VLDDEEARLTLQQVEQDLAVMQKKETDAVLVDIAAAAAQESTQLLRQAELTEQISRKTADTDVSIRQAVAAIQVAQDAFDRATKSRKAFRTSVSDQELVQLNYELKKSRLDEEQARLNRELERLQADSQSAVVAQRQTGSSRLLLQKKQTQLEQDLVALQVRQMRTAVALAKEKLERRKINSPLSGVVVENLCYPGEWVMAGNPVLRVIYLDELYVEGYADAESVDASFQGRPVRVRVTTRSGAVTVTGRLVFVSPETDGVNRQVQVRAEIPNADLQLRPGQRVQMTITVD
jgi:multidrug resistance efflux pump